MRTPFLALLLVLEPLAVLADLPRESFPIAEEKVGYAPHARRAPLVAASNTQFLAAWWDSRQTPYGTWAARIGRDGRVIDRVGFPLPGWLVRGVASDGEDFLVVTGYRELRVTRVAANGVVETRPGLSSTVDDLVALIWTGEEYVLFLASRNWDARAIQVVVLDRDGQVVSNARAVVQPESSVSSLVAASNGDTVVLAWSVGSKSYVKAFGREELRSGDAFVPRSTLPLEWGPAPRILGLASDGRGYMVTWETIESPSGVRRHHSRAVAADGSFAGDVVDLGEPVGRRLAWDGASYVSPAADDTALLRFDRAGRPAGRDDLASLDAMSIEALASLDGVTLVLWRLEIPAVQALHVEIAGTRMRELLSRGHADRRDAAVVWRGDHYLAVWREIAFGQRIVMGRFTAAGAPLDGAGIALSVVSEEDLGGPRIASDGEGALVSWSEPGANASHVVHVARDMTITAHRVESISPPEVHWNGEQYLVVGVPAMGYHGSVSAMRLRANGTLVDALPVRIASYGVPPAAIGWAGYEYVIVFREASGYSRLQALSLSRELVPIGSLLTMSSWTANDSVRIGESLRGLLVVWSQPDAGGKSVRAARIEPHGLAPDALNGIRVATANVVTSVRPTSSGWSVITGSDAWAVSADGRVGVKSTPFGFVDDPASMTVVPDGPAPLVVYRDGSQLVARFASGPRVRAVQR